MDRRQSAAALAIRRGVGRLLRDMGAAVVPELVLASGRRADLAAIDETGRVTIVEIKSSIADFRGDAKWPHYCIACDRFYFATLPETDDVFPQDEGLIVTDGYAADVVRAARERRLSAAARRAVTLRFAQTAARRLHEIEDPAPRHAIPA